MPSCDVLCSLNDESHMLDCAPSPQFNENAHVYNDDDPTFGCDSSFTLDP